MHSQTTKHIAPVDLAQRYGRGGAPVLERTTHTHTYNKRCNGKQARNNELKQDRYAEYAEWAHFNKDLSDGEHDIEAMERHRLFVQVARPSATDPKKTHGKH